MAKVWCALGSVMFLTMLVEPSLAAMGQDLSDCSATNRAASAEACSRVLNSGRLPKDQFFIGYYNRGWAHFYAGEFDKAQEDFELSGRHNVRFADAVLGRALVKLELGARDQVRPALDQYLQLKGEVEIARFNRALIFRRLGDLDRALLEIPADQKGQNGSLLKALILSDQGEHAKARAEIDAVVKRGPASAAALQTRAAIAYRDGRLGDAEADAKSAGTLKNGFAEAIFQLGQIAEARGDHASAAAYYRQVVALAPISIESFWARRDAQARLRATDPGARSGGAMMVGVSRTDCRRFIPSAGLTIATQCQ